MDDCLGYLIGIGIVGALVVAFIVYVVIPLAAVFLGVCVVAGVLIGIWNTIVNYYKTIREVVAQSKEDRK